MVFFFLVAARCFLLLLLRIVRACFDSRGLNNNNNNKKMHIRTYICFFFFYFAVSVNGLNLLCHALVQTKTGTYTHTHTHIDARFKLKCASIVKLAINKELIYMSRSRHGASFTAVRQSWLSSGSLLFGAISTRHFFLFSFFFCCYRRRVKTGTSGGVECCAAVTFLCMRMPWRQLPSDLLSELYH